MDDNIFISDYLKLDDELVDENVFDAIITSDSNFYINILKLKDTKIKEFSNSYNRINNYFDNLLLLLKSSNKNDVFYRRALKLFDFKGVKEINLGFSTTKRDSGLTGDTARQIVSDAYEIVKKGIEYPEIFHLIGLFEDGVGPDKISDMIARIIYDDLKEYTKNINIKLGINSENYPELSFDDGIVMNPYKNCGLFYVPTEILHKLPIASCWEDVDAVKRENQIVRDEINEVVKNEWYKMSTLNKKEFMKNYLINNPDKCKSLIDDYHKYKVTDYVIDDVDYLSAKLFNLIMKSGVMDFLEHSAKSINVSSYDGSLRILDFFKEFIEENKGWYILQAVDTIKCEKVCQRLIHLAGKQYASDNDLDLSFEANEGNGDSDLKVSRGADKTVIEVKLSSNQDFLHGYNSQIIEYAKSENTKQMIYVYVKNKDFPDRDMKIQQEYEKQKNSGNEYIPELFIVNALDKPSASKTRKK